MTHIWYQAETIPNRITNHMFMRIPKARWDEWPGGIPDEEHPENILNPFTVWNQVPLFYSMVKRFMKKFILDPGFVTNPDALVYLDHHHLSPEQLSGALNLILHTAFPNWEADLANVPQLDPNLCYTLDLDEGRTKFSITKDARFCQFMRIAMAQCLAKTVYQLFGVGISRDAEDARLRDRGGPAPPFVNGPGGGYGHGPGPGHGRPAGAGGRDAPIVISMADEVQGIDRENAAANGYLEPDRIKQMQDDRDCNGTFVVSAQRGGNVQDRLQALKTGLDIDGVLSDANVYRILLLNSLYGKGISGTEFRALSAQLAKNIERHYKDRFKVGTELWQRVGVFCKTFGKFQFGTYSRNSDMVDFLNGPDSANPKKAAVVSDEHGLRYMVQTLCTILREDLWIDTVDFEEAFLKILIHLLRENRVSVDVLYHDVVKTVFRMFANLMDNRSGWVSETCLLPRPKPIQLIAASDISRIDQSLPRNTIDCATQCIECIDKAKKTGALNGHLDVGKYEAQHLDHAARFKAAEKAMQQMQSKLQSMQQKGFKGQPAPAPAPQPAPAPAPGAVKRDLNGAVVAGVLGTVGLPPGIVQRKPMKAIGSLTAEFVTAWRDVTMDRTQMKQGPNRCISGDIATVPGYEAWLAKCTAIDADGHKQRRWFHADEPNPKPSADGSNPLVDTFPVDVLLALLLQYNIPTAP